MNKIITLLSTIALSFACLFIFAACGDESNPATAPGAVAAFAVVEGADDDAGKFVLSWTAPTSDGDSAITGYQVSKDNWTTKEDVAATVLSHTIAIPSGMVEGDAFTFRVRAVNAEGVGEERTVTAGLYKTLTASVYVRTKAEGGRTAAFHINYKPFFVPTSTGVSTKCNIDATLETGTPGIAAPGETVVLEITLDNAAILSIGNSFTFVENFSPLKITADGKILTLIAPTVA